MRNISVPSCHWVECVDTYIHVCVPVLHLLSIPSVSLKDHIVVAFRAGN